MVRDALSGGTYRVGIRPGERRPDGMRGRNVVLIRSKAVAGHGEEARSFPLNVFERAVLSMLREVKPEDVLPPENDRGREAEGLEQELAAVRAELTEVNSDLETDGYSKALATRARSLEAQEKDLQARRDKARRDSTRGTEAAWGEFRDLADLLDNAPDPADARLRLRAALRRVVESVWLLVCPSGHDRFAAVQVRFVGGGQREYLLWYRRPRSNGKVRVEGWWRVVSCRSAYGHFHADSDATIGLAPWDLSDPAGVERTELMLSVSDADIEDYFREHVWDAASGRFEVREAPRHPLP
jgi:hypothetical protein